jgi:hypothetical protein
LGYISSSDHTSRPLEVGERSGDLQVDRSDEVAVYSDWEGFGNSVFGNEAGQEEYSESSAASLPNTASLLGKYPHIILSVLKFYTNKIIL